MKGELRVDGSRLWARLVELGEVGAIKGPNGDFHGKVLSERSKCEVGRKVMVYKQKGSSQQPRQDTKIGSDIAQPNGPDSMWSINTGKSGKFYAKAVETAKCHHAFSDTVRSQ